MILSVDTMRRSLFLNGQCVPCTIGRRGVCPESAKREGDGCTPSGDWAILSAIIRPDRGLPVPSGLPWRRLRRDDGWSDDPADPAYNRPVQHPHSFSAERLWRSDALYDAIIVLGHNASPPKPGAGSAIFLHVADGPFTEGCVAIARHAMAALLPRLASGDVLRID